MAKVPVVGHQQDDDVSCGRACAQMVIGFERARRGNAGSTLPDQPVMAAAEANVIAGWDTDPHELVKHINDALAATVGAATWFVSVSKAAIGSTDPDLEAATPMIAAVHAAIDRGFPSVVMTDRNDHWEVVVGYDGDLLYAKDPLPRLLGPGPFHHVDGSDGCEPLDDSIWFLNSVSAREFICDAPPYAGQAVAIIQNESGRGITLTRHRAAEVSPFPPDPLGAGFSASSNPFGRNLVRLMRALSRLDEPPPFDGLDWANAVTHEVRFVGRPNEVFNITAVRSKQPQIRSLLLFTDDKGRLQVVRATRLHRLVNTLIDPPLSVPRLWIVHGAGRFQPYAIQSVSADSVLLRRLHDGHEWTVKDTEVQTE